MVSHPDCGRAGGKAQWQVQPAPTANLIGERLGLGVWQRIGLDDVTYGPCRAVGPELCAVAASAGSRTSA